MSEQSASEPDANPATFPQTKTEPIMSNPTEPNLTEPIDFLDTKKHPESAQHPVRVGTIVWGAVVVALGILVILTRQAGLALDAGQTAIWLLLGAGVAMVTGGAVNLLRKNRP